MRKTLIAISAAMILSITANADAFEDSLSEIMTKNVGMEIKVVEKTELSNWSGVFFTIIESKTNGQRFPLFASKDGKSVIGYSNLMITPSKEDETKIGNMLNAAKEYNEKSKDGAIKELFAKLDKDSFIALGDPKKPSIIVVSDPECPYCRKELANINERLKEKSIKLVLAPVHDKSAFVKSELIYKEAAKAKDDAAKIKILNKYFDEKAKVDAKDMSMATPITDKNKETIFSSGLIRGVPFIFEEK